MNTERTTLQRMRAWRRTAVIATSGLVIVAVAVAVTAGHAAGRAERIDRGIDAVSAGPAVPAVSAAETVGGSIDPARLAEALATPCATDTATDCHSAQVIYVEGHEFPRITEGEH